METLDRSPAIETILDRVRRAAESARVLVLFIDERTPADPNRGIGQEPFRPEWGEDQVIGLDEDF